MTEKSNSECEKFTFMLPLADYDQLRQIAFNKRISIAEVLRDLVAAALAKGGVK